MFQMQVDENRLKEIRLHPVSAQLPTTEGVVEVKDKEDWVHICNFGWTAENTLVVCGMMGFPSGKTMAKKTHRYEIRHYMWVLEGNIFPLTVLSMRK